MMNRDGLLALLAAALLVLPTGCDHRGGSETMNPEVEQSCLEEGFDRGTTEFANCVEELSESGQ